MSFFALKCETAAFKAPIRTITVNAETSDEANRIFQSSNEAPFPQMRSKGYIPISIILVQG